MIKFHTLQRLTFKDVWDYYYHRPIAWGRTRAVDTNAVSAIDVANINAKKNPGEM